MIAKLGNWIREFAEDEKTAPAGDSEWAALMASLLVEAAMADGELDDDERAQITRILAAQPTIDPGAVDGLIDTALSWHAERVEIHALTRSIRTETEAEDRIAVMEMAWMVVLADGEAQADELAVLTEARDALGLSEDDEAKARALAEGN